MRDFNAGRDLNIHGDVKEYHQPVQEYKPLSLCTNEELYNERVFRKGRLKIEQKKQLKGSGKFFLFAVFIALCIACYYYITKEVNSAMFIVGVVGVIAPIAIGNLEYRKFDQVINQHYNALKEIRLIFRERGVEE